MIEKTHGEKDDYTLCTAATAMVRIRQLCDNSPRDYTRSQIC